MDILLVEDNALIGDAIVGHMTAIGSRVDWRQGSAEAMVAIEGRSFDCVVLDLRLPDGHGLSLLQHIRERNRQVPILILSAFDQISDRVATLTRGANDYLVKPFSLADFQCRVSRLVTAQR